MTNAELVIAGATLVGPVLAVQAQKWIEILRERRGLKVRVFATLMATRAARLSADHVQALNMISIAFYGWRFWGSPLRSKKEQAVLDAWNEYHDNLSTDGVTDIELQRLYAQRDETFLNLLHAMALSLHYGFDRVQLKKGGYTPVAHGTLEEDQRRIRELTIGMLGGNIPLKVMPVPPVPPVAPAPKAPPKADPTG